MTTSKYGFYNLLLCHFIIRFNNVSAYKVASPLIKKPEKDLHFKDVCVCVNLENCEYLFLQKSQQCLCVLLLKRILNVYYHT